jgi:protein O-GlcNAc transferase
MNFVKEIKSNNKMIISFSLWGDDEKYFKGVFENVKIANRIYKGWICRFHIESSVFQTHPLVIEFLEKCRNTEIIQINRNPSWEGLFWRFFPCGDSNVKIMISRDLDSRLSLRERVSVNQWVKSKMNFHIMRDHPNHNYKILGGMWGVKCQYMLKDIIDLINRYNCEDRFNIDQEFLEEIIFPIASEDSFINDPFFERIPFLLPRLNWNFIGNVYSKNNEPNSEYKSQLKKHILSKKKDYFKIWIKQFMI